MLNYAGGYLPGNGWFSKSSLPARISTPEQVTPERFVMLDLSGPCDFKPLASGFIGFKFWHRTTFLLYSVGYFSYSFHQLFFEGSS